MNFRIYSIRYGFTQHFTVPARKAYDWCTDYKPYDLSLMRLEGSRRIRKLTDDAILLSGTTFANGKAVKKTKLVRLNRRRLSWSNTHLSGPFLNSQFLYQMSPVGKNRSKLKFDGLLLVYSPVRLSRDKIRRIAKQERQQDSTSWRHLAKAMAEEVRKISFQKFMNSN
ncbi:MAG: hypothetical protein ABSF00_03820 [Candidatus Bathyarchaeia archaeon]